MNIETMLFVQGAYCGAGVVVLCIIGCMWLFDRYGG